MKNKLSRFLILLGLVLVTCSLILIGYNLIIDYRAGVLSKSALEEIVPIIESNRNNSSDSNDTLEVEVDKNRYIGIITMDSVGIKLPVLKEYSQANLKIAPNLYKGSIYEDNAIIIAHNSISHFKKIEKLNIGDLVIFEDINGNKFQYEVTYKERISEKDTDIMDQGDWDLTLFTCASNIRFRSTVRLKRVEFE